MTTFIKIGAKRYDAADYDTPLEKTFRDAWAADDTTGVIEVDLERAKDLWRDKLRAARINPLAALDAKFMMALEKGEDTSAIVLAKQILRDAPHDPAITSATTLAQLQTIFPKGLIIK